MSIVQLPARLAAGAFILNSGLGKKDLPDDAIKHLQQMGATGVPALKDLTPEQFRTVITVTEIGLGAALLIPLVPGWLAGGALAAFSGGLLNMYRKTPGLTIDGIRPTQEGTAIAKDIFLFGIAGTLILDSIRSRAFKKLRKKLHKGS